MASLWRQTLGQAVEVHLHHASNLWRTKTDRSQLEAALLNLVINARDAMGSSGVLTVETANVRLDPAAPHADDAPSGEFAMIAVSDTGEGMEPERLARVFEPFFTTKEVGKGSGLGLSMVYGFVNQSGGHVNIYSEVGIGTTIRIFLPRAEGAKPAAAAQEEPKASPRSRDETVMVVEDNHEIRRIAVRQLIDLGYEVVEAENGKLALAQLMGDVGVDLLFTDVVMPGGIDGLELVRAARLHRPGLKVLYTTGFTQAATRNGGTFTGEDSLISKPYRKADLALKVREVLDS
jgi:CheY-like chemotaxis protein